MQIQNAREFFESLESRAAGSSKAAGVTASYLFEIDGAGTWTVDVDDGKVAVRDGGDSAETTISTSEQTFVKIVNGDQNPMTAYMTGKIRVKGKLDNAMKLQRLF